jgi:hypothetical protein
MISGDSCRRAARNAAVSASRRGASQARTRRRSFAGISPARTAQDSMSMFARSLGGGPERVAVDGRRSARRCREALPGPSVVTPLPPLNPARTAKRRGVTPTPQTDRGLLVGSVDRVTRSWVEWQRPHRLTAHHRCVRLRGVAAGPQPAHSEAPVSMTSIRKVNESVIGHLPSKGHVAQRGHQRAVDHSAVPGAATGGASGMACRRACSSVSGQNAVPVVW